MNRADKFSAAISEMRHSGIRKFFELIIGRDDIITLGVGEPDFATPWHIREEAFHHLERGHTSYTSNWGILELRREIARYLEKYEIAYNYENEILVTVGASEAVDLVLRAILNPGDQIIVCEPCYVSYLPLAKLLGAELIHLDTSLTDFIPTAEAVENAITPKTKALMLCSPSNPTGRMIPREELRRIADVVKKHEIWALSDEIYCELRYDGNTHTSIASFPGMKEYAVVFNGFSKALAMTGWRIGYVCAAKPLMEQVFKLHQYAAICAPIMSQYAAIEGLKNGAAEVEKMRQSYQQRRNLAHNVLKQIGLSAAKPDGAFYIFPDMRCTGFSSEEFAERLINEYSVAVVPGSVFGAGGEGFVRCCYATDAARLKTALERISAMVEKYRR
ncbi:MAG: aminotransferase [Treponemataceae bacterium]|nr:MAG: aminotransferase [Treponemataceae bacterium]